MQFPLPDFVAVSGANDRETAGLRSRWFHNGGSTGTGRRGPKAFLELAKHGTHVVGHGIPSPALASLLGECGSPYIDTEYLSRIVLPTLSFFDIESVCAVLNIPPGGGRALRTGKLFLGLMERVSSHESRTIQLLSRLLSMSGKVSLSDIVRSTQNSFSRGQDHSSTESADLNHEVVPDSGEEPDPITWSEILGVLGSGGTLEAEIACYEERREQLDMARSVMEAINAGRVLLAEAGTGTGKSFAYLVPAVLWAVKNNRRMVVSTNTKNLQDQLFEKDLPSLEKAMPLPFTYRLLKGRQNYFCMERFHEFVDTEGFLMSPAEADRLIPLVTWSYTTETGDIAENRLFDTRRDSMIWQKVNCDVRYCPARDSFRDCFLSRVRKNAQESHVVVINHALLLNDIIMDRAILGRYDSLVIDEAHNLENVAHDQLGRAVSYLRFRRFFDRVFGGDNSGAGLVEKIRDKGFGKSADSMHLSLSVTEEVKNCRRLLSRFFASLSELLDPSGKGFAERKRFKPGDSIASFLGERVKPPLEILRRTRAGMVRLCDDLIRELESEDAGERSQLKELRGAIEELTELIGDLEFLTGVVEEEWVYWIQGDESPGRIDFISLRACPIEVAPFIKNMIYENTRSVILSSATLSVAGNFSFYSRILGTDLLDSEQVMSFRGGTSFPLEKQVLLLLPTFIPSVLENEFIEKLPRFLERAVTAVSGGTLVLFTSRGWIKRIQSNVKRLLVPLGIQCLAQGEDGSREVLIDQFREGKHSVLLGTASFWEGIDVPGEALQQVIIVRLPFPVPSEPITEAISERMSLAGENPFTDYALPKAAIRLKQGFGRLIRSRQDKGAVLILDKRIVEKRYGIYLQGALEVRPLAMNDDDVLFLTLRRWCESSNDHVYMECFEGGDNEERQA